MAGACVMMIYLVCGTSTYKPSCEEGFMAEKIIIASSFSNPSSADIIGAFFALCHLPEFFISLKTKKTGLCAESGRAQLQVEKIALHHESSDKFVIGGIARFDDDEREWAVDGVYDFNKRQGHLIVQD